MSPPAAAFCAAELAVFLFHTLWLHPSLGTCPYQSQPSLGLELGRGSGDPNSRDRDLQKQLILPTLET